jgi:hypothetical protein
MSRKPRVQRTPEEKWQIVLEGLKSGNIAETCRKYEIAPNRQCTPADLDDLGHKLRIVLKDFNEPEPKPEAPTPAVPPPAPVNDVAEE